MSRFPQLTTEKEDPFGYCTEFVLQGHKKLYPEKLKKSLADEGQSLIVAGDENLVHIHIHTFDPGKVLHQATSLGILHEIKIQNMDDQHREYTEMVKAQAPPPAIATVAVVSGDGLGQVFRSLGVGAIVPGGQTMNPSTREMLQAVESVPQQKVIILPNNKNVIPAAKQVQELTSKKVKVVPTQTVPQGVAALLAFNYDADFKTNAATMEDALSGGEDHRGDPGGARRPGSAMSRFCNRQAIGFVDGELKAVGDKPAEVLLDVLQKMETEKSEIVTVYYGKTTRRSEAEGVVEEIRQKLPQPGSRVGLRRPAALRLHCVCRVAS